MPNTKFDKYYMEELAKKFKSDDHLDEFLEEVKQIQRQKGNLFAQEFQNVVNYQLGRIEEVEKEQRDLKLKQAEAAKSNLASDNWSQEELQALTKGIAKYPPGTVNRWKVVADHIGTKDQK